MKLSYLNSTQPTDFHHQILKLKTYPENQFWILYGALQGKGHIDVTAKIQYENQRWESGSKRIRMLFSNKDEEEKNAVFTNKNYQIFFITNNKRPIVQTILESSIIFFSFL